MLNLNDVIEMILDFLKVILSWPVTILILGGVFLLLFNNEIKQFLRDLVIRHRWPGGGETELSQRQQESRFEMTPIKEEQKEEEIRKRIQEGEKEKVNEIITSLMERIRDTDKRLLFENTYNFIYGSQIRLLEYLSKKPSSGDSYQSLYSLFYDSAARLYPMLRSYPFENYMNFLEGRELVKRENDNFKITPTGIDFLNYIDVNNYLKNKAF